MVPATWVPWPSSSQPAGSLQPANSHSSPSMSDMSVVKLRESFLLKFGAQVGVVGLDAGVEHADGHAVVARVDPVRLDGVDHLHAPELASRAGRRRRAPLAALTDLPRVFASAAFLLDDVLGLAMAAGRVADRAVCGRRRPHAAGRAVVVAKPALVEVTVTQADRLVDRGHGRAGGPQLGGQGPWRTCPGRRGRRTTSWRWLRTDLVAGGGGCTCHRDQCCCGQADRRGGGEYASSAHGERSSFSGAPGRHHHIRDNLGSGPDDGNPSMFDCRKMSGDDRFA